MSVRTVECFIVSSLHYCYSFTTKFSNSEAAVSCTVPNRKDVSSSCTLRRGEVDRQELCFEFEVTCFFSDAGESSNASHNRNMDETEMRRY